VEKNLLIWSFLLRVLSHGRSASLFEKTTSISHCAQSIKIKTNALWNQMCFVCVAFGRMGVCAAAAHEEEKKQSLVTICLLRAAWKLFSTLPPSHTRPAAVKWWFWLFFTCAEASEGVVFHFFLAQLFLLLHSRRGL